MTQDIIVLTIVFLTAVYAIWSIVKTLQVKSSGGCGDDCACSAKSDIKKAMQAKKNEINGKKLKVLR